MKKTIFVLFCCLCFVSMLQANPSPRKRRFSNALTRAVLTPAQRNQALLKAVQNPHALGQVRRLLNQGADPCRALPFAVFTNNVEAVHVLAEYKNRCNWKIAVEERLRYVMRKDLVELFYALMADNRGITCPDPFEFTPAQRNSQWHPLSSEMLAAVNQRCFQTTNKQAGFLKNMILLNSRQNNAFLLGEMYQQGIKSSKTQQNWLKNIDQLVKAKVKVSNDTLESVISQSRVTNYEGKAQLPFETTRQLVKLCLKGGADGKAVLNNLDQEYNAWVWEPYSNQERMRLSNILEHKPEMQPRSFADRVRNWFN